MRPLSTSLSPSDITLLSYFMCQKEWENVYFFNNAMLFLTSGSLHTEVCPAFSGKFFSTPSAYTNP